MEWRTLRQGANSLRSVGAPNSLFAPLREQPPLSESLSQDSTDYLRFKEAIYRKTGIDLNLYKQQQMQRRLYNMVERAGLKTFEEYFALINREDSAFFSFLDRMTINVSELFRNPEKWQELQTYILPSLLKARSGLRIWSAGCSYGAEPYTLAILLDELSSGTQHILHATDLDRKMLAKAREGCFTTTDVKGVALPLLSRYFLTLDRAKERQSNPTLPIYQVKPEIRSGVAFQQHNLLADRFDKDYDLICCRNVVIYFTDEAKDRLYQQFVQSLRIGGFLFVGGTERILNYAEMGLESPYPFFYRRIR